MCIQIPLWLSDFVSAHSGGLCVTAAVTAYVGMWLSMPVRL